MVAFTSPPRSPHAHRSTHPLPAGTVTTPPSSAGATNGSAKSRKPTPLTLGELWGLDLKAMEDVGEAPPLNMTDSARQALGEWPPLQESAGVQGQIPGKQKFIPRDTNVGGTSGGDGSGNVTYDNAGLLALASAAEIYAPAAPPTSLVTSTPMSRPYTPSLEVDGFEEIPAPNRKSSNEDPWIQPKKPVKKSAVRAPTSLDKIRASPPPATSRKMALALNAQMEVNGDLLALSLGPKSAPPSSSTMSATATPFQVPAIPSPSTPPPLTHNELLNTILSPPRQSGKRTRPVNMVTNTPLSTHIQKKVKVESPTSTNNTSIIWQYVTTPTSSTIAALPLDEGGNMQVDEEPISYEAQTAVGLGLTSMGDTLFQTFVVDDYLPNASSDPNTCLNQSEQHSRSVQPQARGDLGLAFPTAAPDSPSPAPRRISTIDTTELRSALPRPNNDVIMRSPSPTVSALLQDRLSAAVKGKQRAWPTLEQSSFREGAEEWSFRGRTSLVNHQSPNALVASIFPPPPLNATEFQQYRTPARPSSIVNRHALFESNLSSRGPPISATILADRFPLRESPSVHPTPHPPSPYFEDGELPDPIAGKSNLLDFVQQQAENAPAEHDDFLTYLPPPVGGFPRVHFASPTGAFENIDDSQLLDWERLRCNGLVALGISFGGHGALDGDVDPKYRQLISYATHLLNARFHTDRIAIAQPRPKSRVTTLNAPPHTALLYGITKDEATILSEEGVMCTPRLAMFFHKLDVIFPAFIGAIHGLTTRVIEPVYDMVLTHFLSPEAEKIFSTLAARLPNSVVTPDGALTFFLNSMYVRRLDCRAKGNTHSPVFLVYMRSPASDYHSHRIWTTFCKKMNLSHSLYGNGYLRTPGICALCHGHDHPTGLCRFPNVEGWNAPPPYHPPNFSIPLPPSHTREVSRTPKQAGKKGQLKGKKRRNAPQTNPSTPR